jgi:hypothetical protein
MSIAKAVAPELAVIASIASIIADGFLQGAVRI